MPAPHAILKFHSPLPSPITPGSDQPVIREEPVFGPPDLADRNILDIARVEVADAGAEAMVGTARHIDIHIDRHLVSAAGRLTRGGGGGGLMPIPEHTDDVLDRIGGEAQALLSTSVVAAEGLTLQL